MVGVGKVLWGSSSPTPLPKQGHLQQAAQDLAEAGLEYLQRRRLHNLWAACASAPSLHKVKKFFLTFRLPMLQFVPVAPCPVAGHH